MSVGELDPADHVYVHDSISRHFSTVCERHRVLDWSCNDSHRYTSLHCDGVVGRKAKVVQETLQFVPLQLFAVFTCCLATACHVSLVSVCHLLDVFVVSVSRLCCVLFFKWSYSNARFRNVNTGFLQTIFRLLKTGFKPVFSFTGLCRNLNFKQS